MNEKFDASAGGKVVIEVDFGAITVTAGNDQTVNIHAHRKIDANDEGREKEYVAAVPIVITHENNLFTVQSRRAQSREHWDWSGNVNMDAEYTVTVPKNFNAELRTRGGAITAEGLTGQVTADTNGGKMRFAKITDPIEARTSGGSIVLDTCMGNLNVATSGGTIDCKSGGGHLNARTSGGSITVRDFGGDAEVKTSGGKLTIENIAGALSGKTSAGSINAALPNPVPGDVTSQTSAGSIDVALSEKSAVTVDAKTGIGSIRTEIPMLATHSRDNRLEGILNGGGRALVLQTSVGSINIRPKVDPSAAR